MTISKMAQALWFSLVKVNVNPSATVAQGLPSLDMHKLDQSTK
jgi:hypothetical protein